MSIELITQNQFEDEVEKVGGAVLVDFFAEWCGPCKMISPLLDKLAQAQGDRVKIVKVDADEAQDLMARYSIRGVPTLLLFVDGEKVATQVGAVSYEALCEFIEQAFA